MKVKVDLKTAIVILNTKSRALRKQIRDGKQVGQISGHKGWVMIEDWLLPGYQGKEDSLSKRKYEAQRDEIEASEIRAATKLAEARKERDTPQELANQKQSLNKREEKIEALATKLWEYTKAVDRAYADATEDEQEALGEDIKVAFVGLRDFIKTIKKEDDSMFEG